MSSRFWRRMVAFRGTGLAWDYIREQEGFPATGPHHFNCGDEVRHVVTGRCGTVLRRTALYAVVGYTGVSAGGYETIVEETEIEQCDPNYAVVSGRRYT